MKTAEEIREYLYRTYGGTGMVFIDPVDGDATIFWHPAACGEPLIGLGKDGDFEEALRDAEEE